MTTTTTNSPPSPARRTRRWTRVLLPIVLLLCGIAVMVYPVAATQYNNYRQQQFADRNVQQVGGLDDQRRADALARARAYNATLSGIPILDPYLGRLTQARRGEGAYGNYLDQLADFDAMARLRVPAARIDLPVRHGTDDAVLASGAGHLYGTSLPVGGEGTHAVLTSHTAFADATLFNDLVKLRAGDRFLIDVYGETLAYEVDRIDIVLPQDVSGLKSEPDADLVTLFTCTPYAVNTHRLMVRGHRVPFEPGRDAVGVTARPWHLDTSLALLLGGAAAGIGVLTVIGIRERRRARAKMVPTRETS